MNTRFKRFRWGLASILIVAFGGTAAAQNHGYPSGGTGPTVPDPPAAESNAARLDAIRQTAYSRQITSLRRLTSRIVRGTARFSRAGNRRLVQAGPDFRLTDVAADVSYGVLKHMNVTATGEDAEGYVRETVVGIGWELGEAVGGGFELTNSRTYVRGPNGWETEATGGDAYLTLELNEIFTIGAFGTAEQIDVEGFNDNGFRYTGAATVTGQFQLGDTNLAASVVLAGTSEDVTRREYDTLLCSLLDAETKWSEKISTSVFVYGSDSLRQDMPGDRSFWTVGADVDYAATDRWGLTFGYEKALAIKDFREDRLHLTLTYSW
ncbi:MAG: hypothetical protein GXP31_09845 [Kiritimatiellaeota bacterium]|nr:hypothetical protein [Kiritimatiellota bacterium]